MLKSKVVEGFLALMSLTFQRLLEYTGSGMQTASAK